MEKDKYTMDGKPDIWTIAYYPLYEDGKTGEKYLEPRALIEKAELVLAIDGKGSTYIINSIESYKNLPNAFGFNIEIETT